MCDILGYIFVILFFANFFTPYLALKKSGLDVFMVKTRFYIVLITLIGGWLLIFLGGSFIMETYCEF